jgi:hypothetical protein
MVAKLCAVWFVVLSVLPFTAPFSTMDVADVIVSHGVGAEICPPTSSTTDSGTEDIAVGAERADSCIRAWLHCVAVPYAHADIIARAQRLLNSPTSTSRTTNLPPRPTVLRL